MNFGAPAVGEALRFFQLLTQIEEPLARAKEARALVTSFGFAVDTVQPSSDRHWTWIGRKA